MKYKGFTAAQIELIEKIAEDAATRVNRIPFSSPDPGGLLEKLAEGAVTHPVGLLAGLSVEQIEKVNEIVEAAKKEAIEKFAEKIIKKMPKALVKAGIF